MLQARLEVDEVRRTPRHQHTSAPRLGQVADPVHGRLARIGDGRVRRDGVDLGQAALKLARLLDGDDPRIALDL